MRPARSPLGAPTFYHDARVEAGGSTPDRMFSYYVGISGTNQDFRYFDQYNGASLTDTIPYGYWPSYVTTLPPFWPAVYPACRNNSTYNNPAVNKGLSPTIRAASDRIRRTTGSRPPSTAATSSRNFHVGVPHRHDGGRDDIQLLLHVLRELHAVLLEPRRCRPARHGYRKLTAAGQSLPTFTRGIQSVAGLLHVSRATRSGSPRPRRRRSPITIPARRPARCANVTGVRNACPVNAARLSESRSSCRRTSATALGYREHREAPVSEEHRLHGLRRASSATRSTPTPTAPAANGWGNNVTLGVTNYQYEVDSHTGGLEMQFADQLSGASICSRAWSRTSRQTRCATPTTTTSTRRARSRSATSPTARDASPPTHSAQYHVGDPAPCNKYVSQGSSTRPFGAFGSADPCADGEISAQPAGLRRAARRCA